MVLAVVVIGGLVGSGALGYEVAQGLQRNAVRAGRARVARDPRARDRTRPGHAGSTALQAHGARVERETTKEERHEGRVGGSLRSSASLAVGAVAYSSQAARRRAQRSQLRHGDAQRAGVGGLDRQHVRREGRAREGLGCKVKITQIAEIPVYQAMADGKTDAVLEDWSTSPQYKQYVDEAEDGRDGRARTASSAHIGWYIPTYLMKQHPRVQDVEGPEGQGVALQEPGVRLAGDVPRRRPVVRAEGHRR